MKKVLTPWIVVIAIALVVLVCDWAISPKGAECDHHFKQLTGVHMAWSETNEDIYVTHALCLICDYTRWDTLSIEVGRRLYEKQFEDRIAPKDTVWRLND